MTADTAGPGLGVGRGGGGGGGGVKDRLAGTTAAYGGGLEGVVVGRGVREGSTAMQVNCYWRGETIS